ncbi:DUF6406 domain-containing protein [Streptomyces sp. NPDC048606]|uniref:DUF6406 domain-containing protein n=1 Tax=Streptomyces sp. NPDC048606 TaxID=3154726 RepID=UPI003418983A
MPTEIKIGPGVLTDSPLGAFGVIDVDARPGLPLTVRLGVDDGEERRYTLSLGDTFPVRGELWRLDRVEDPDGDYRVYLRKVV